MALTTYQLPTMTSGAANTKGAYVEVITSTPYASSRLHLTLRSTGTVSRFLLLDLATGAAGVETVVVANLPVVTDSDAVNGGFVAVDLDVPAGTRLAARVQGFSASQTFTINVLLESRALGTLAGPVTFGANTTLSRGTQVDPGATINTKGAYVQFSSSTPSRIDALLVCCTVTTESQAITPFVTWTLDVATGAAGVETVVVPDLVCVANSPTDVVRPNYMRIPVSIPAGSRLAVRCACTMNTATMRQLSVTALGMQEPVAVSAGVTLAVGYVG